MIRVFAQPVIGHYDPNAFSSCRLYSWMRLTWQSNMRVRIHLLPGRLLEPVGKQYLRIRALHARKASHSAVSLASGFSRLSWLKSVIQSFPDRPSVIASGQRRICPSSHRRGVTPLVLLLKRSGYISARSFTVVVRNSSNGSAATPFVLCEPTMARLAMRILRWVPLPLGSCARAPLIAGEPQSNLIEETPVDLVNDL